MEHYYEVTVIPVSCVYKCLQIRQLYPIVIPYLYGCRTCKHCLVYNGEHRLTDVFNTLYVVCTISYLYGYRPNSSYADLPSGRYLGS